MVNAPADPVSSFRQMKFYPDAKTAWNVHRSLGMQVAADWPHLLGYVILAELAILMLLNRLCILPKTACLCATSVPKILADNRAMAQDLLTSFSQRPVILLKCPWYGKRASCDPRNGESDGSDPKHVCRSSGQHRRPDCDHFRWLQASSGSGSTRLDFLKPRATPGNSLSLTPIKKTK